MANEIYKNLDGTWHLIDSINYMDGVTPRTILESYYNDTGVWRQVYGAAAAAATLVFAPGTPTGDYLTVIDNPTTMQFNVTTGGLFFFTPSDSFDAASTGTPTSGTFQAGGNDAVSYEISISAGPVTGDGTLTAIGAGTLLGGTFQPLDTQRGCFVSSGLTSNVTSAPVTVIIREINAPTTNMITASFSISADNAT